MLALRAFTCTAAMSLGLAITSDALAGDQPITVEQINPETKVQDAVKTGGACTLVKTKDGRILISCDKTVAPDLANAIKSSGLDQ